MAIIKLLASSLPKHSTWRVTRRSFHLKFAAPIRQYENAFEGLSPWQAQKLYYFTDAFDTEFFRGHGPEYDGKESSPSKHLSYLQLAAQSAAAYYTQLPDPILGKR